MKILLLADINSSHTKKWVQALTIHGIEVSVFSLTAQVGSDISKLSYFSASKEVKRKIAEFKPDIVHAHYATSYGLLGRKSGFHPLVISCWGSDVMDFPKKSFLHRWILKKNLSSADKILATSKTLVDAIHAVVKKDVEITPFGVDTEVFKPLGSGEKTGLTIGTIKSLEKVYRIDMLIEAFARAKKDFPALKLQIVGQGSQRSSLEQLVERLGLKEDVLFKGAVPHAEIALLHNALDIFVNVSDYESFGVSVLEAMACSKPVVVSNTGGLAEIVKDDSVGYKIPVNDVNALVKKLLLLIDNETLRKKMGENARQWVMNQYEWKNNVSQMISVYEKLVRKQ
jgi:L-malate glycosyltransferase